MSETIPGGSGAKGAAGDLGVYPFVTAPQVDDLAVPKSVIARSAATWQSR